MSYATSRYLNHRQMQAVSAIGDVFVPPGNNFPSFSESGCLYNVDIVLEQTPASDLKDLKMVLTLFSFMPEGMLRWTLERLELGDHMPDWADMIASQLRLLLFGLRGIVFSLYYSGQGNPYKPNTVYEVMDYQVTCKPDPRPAEQPSVETANQSS